MLSWFLAVANGRQKSIVQELLSGIGGFLGFLTPFCTFAVRFVIQRSVEKRTQAMKDAAGTQAEVLGKVGVFGKSGEGAFKRALTLTQIESSPQNKVEGKDPKMLEKELRQLAYIDKMDEWVEQDRSGTKVLQLQRAVRVIAHRPFGCS